MSTPAPTDAERSELLALYQVTTQDLAFFKSQQWSLTNYGLLALAALAGVRQFSGMQVTPCVMFILCTVAVAAALITAWLLWRLHGSIEERRARLERLYARFSEEFRKARGEKKSVSAWEMVLPLWFVLTVALGLVLWLLIAGTPAG